MPGAVLDDDSLPAFRLVHVGVAVTSMDGAIKEYESLFGYRLLSGPFHDPLQRVSVCFLSQDPAGKSAGGMTIELVEPAVDDSPVSKALRSGRGGPYHLGYEVDEMEAALAQLRASRCLVVSGPTPAVAFGGRPIAWVYTPSRQLTELILKA